MNIIEQARQTLLAHDLFKAGARIGMVVEELGMCRSTAIKIYRATHGKKATSGMMKTDPSSFLRAGRNMLSVAFINEYASYKNSNNPQQIIDACNSVIRKCDQHIITPLTITDCWTVQRMVNNGLLKILQCKCGRGVLVYPIVRQVECACCTRIPGKLSRMKRDELGLINVPKEKQNANEL